MLEEDEWAMLLKGPDRASQYLKLGPLDIDLHQCWGIGLRQYIVEGLGLDLDMLDITGPGCQVVSLYEPATSRGAEDMSKISRPAGI
jgi:hypothetical protein